MKTSKILKVGKVTTKPKSAGRGRPKGQSKDKRSFGPLGDLLRKARLQKQLGLADVAKKVGCSVQFISNIEHGRAPLPWEKSDALSKVLEIDVNEIQTANLAMRSDFKSFVTESQAAQTGKRLSKPLALKQLSDAASAVAIASADLELQRLLQAYQSANPATRKAFVSKAMSLLS
ncbi:MAG: helix-turn-helix domain-containing protein [Bdellovibrionia bacterium]